MKVVALEDAGVAICDRAEPEPREGWAIIRVRVAGICNTDLELARGYMGFRGVLGHEFAGTVDEGPVDWLGRRVVGEINFACGRCASCRTGLGRHCPTRSVLGILNADGAFAERVAVPLSNLHRIPAAVGDEQAVFVEPLAAAFEILEQVHIEPSTECLVFGDGKLGLLVAQVLDGAGARVAVAGKHPENHTVLVRRGIETLAIADAAARTAPLVVDATGSGEGFARALAATQPRGTLVLKSTLAERMSVDMAPVVINEIRVVGSRCGPFAPALRALERGAIDVDSLVTARYRLDEAGAAFAHAAQPGTLKVLLDNGT